MQPKEMQEVILIKNNLLDRQTRRIKLLEDKMTELRRKYFQLKYADLVTHIKTA